MEETSRQQSDLWQINQVRITLSQTRVYHNGRQQARILLWLQATEDGKFVRLTPTERQNIQLVDYRNSEGYIPFNENGAPNSYRGWSAQRNYLGYSFYPDLASGKGGDEETIELDQDAGESFEFYVSAEDGAQVSRFLSISFSIRGDNGSVWRTTGIVSYADNSDDYFSHLDVRENIEITAVPPVFYSADNFHLDRRSIIAIQPTSAALFDDMVTVSIVAAGGRIIGIRSMECVPAGMIHWINDMPDTSNPCFTGYVRPGEASVQWNPAVPKGSQPLPSLPAPERTKGVIVLCGRIDIPRADHTDPPRGPLSIVSIDEYGTLHARQLLFVRGQRDELKIQ
ncbi:hypothetical protein [Luteibacter sp.]|jgi:hypothetical protein|uniref:hypothetical protein n=1 Tax=Luteibacter sp. TaxID=1886636 RepID=UPI002F42F31D